MRRRQVDTGGYDCICRHRIILNLPYYFSQLGPWPKLYFQILDLLPAPVFQAKNVASKRVGDNVVLYKPCGVTVSFKTTCYHQSCIWRPLTAMTLTRISRENNPQGLWTTDNFAGSRTWLIPPHFPSNSIRTNCWPAVEWKGKWELLWRMEGNICGGFVRFAVCISYYSLIRLWYSLSLVVHVTDIKTLFQGYFGQAVFYSSVAR